MDIDGWMDGEASGTYCSWSLAGKIISMSDICVCVCLHYITVFGRADSKGSRDYLPTVRSYT